MAPVSASSKPTTFPNQFNGSPSERDGGRSLFARRWRVLREINGENAFPGSLISLLKGWALSFTGWGLVAFVLGGKLVLDGASWAMIIRPSIRDWLPWAVLTPIIFQFVMRFPIDRQRWKVTLPLQIFVGIIVIYLCQRWQAFSDPSFRPTPLPHYPPMHMGRPFPSPPSPGDSPPPPNEPPRRGPSRSWVDLFHLVTFGLPIYLMIVSGAHAALFFRRDQQRAASLARARLDVLKGQLQPHFLFNTLNVIAELVHEDPDEADAMITALSDMLRLTLDSASDHLVPLGREIEFVERYVAIMQIRLGERLQYHCEIMPAARNALVPPFLLQPLVENAILHGIEPTPAGGLVTIRASVNEEELHLSVGDDGVGFKGLPEKEGIGLANNRARLIELFGSAAQVTLTSAKGVVVEITMPFRT